MNNPAKRAVILVSDVSFRYSADASLLQNVSFQVFPGEIAILAGGNGCGKSTLVELLLGTLTPVSGTVRIFGKNPAEIHRMPEVGVISEPFNRFFTPLPVGMKGCEILKWLEILDGIHSSDFYTKMKEMALSPLMMNRKIESFSKGERQRFLTGVTLLRAPKLLLTDEPLKGLDSKSRRQIAEQLRTYADSGGTVFWISHHLSETLSYADRFFRVENSAILELPQCRFTVTFRGEEASLEPVSMASLLQLPVCVEEKLKKNGCVTLTVTENQR